MWIGHAAVIRSSKIGRWGARSQIRYQRHISHTHQASVWCLLRSFPMPPKPVSELTKVETTILTIAAKLLAAIKRVQDSPPTPEQLEQFNAKVLDELVSLYTAYPIAYDYMTLNTHIQHIVNSHFGPGMSKTPHIHPIIQLVADEWTNADTAGRAPNWGLFTTSYISRHCRQMAKNESLWHKDLFAVDISSYLQGITNKKKLWWVTEPQRLVGTPDGM
jgi:hypothetical protein